MDPIVTPQARFAALQNRNFTLLWSGLIVSNVGTWMQNVGTGWLILQLKNSPLWLGLLGLSFAVPMIVLPLVGGAIADRINRMKLLYFTQTMMMLTAFALAAVTWMGIVNVWHVLVATLISSSLLAFDNPARQALIPDLVPEKDLLNAISLNAATYNGAALAGPAIAGALLGPFGVGTLFFINGISYLAILFALFAMRDVRTHTGGMHKSIGNSMLAGLAYAWQTRLVFLLLVLSALAAVFGRSYQNLLPIFARDIWQGGPQGYGLLLSAAGAGAMVGAFGLASIKKMKRHGVTLIVSGLLFGISLASFALAPSLWVGVLLLFISGVTSTIFGTMIATFIQIAAPREIRGRIMSLYSITLIGLPSLGALGSGAIAQSMGGIEGAPRAVLIGAIILCIIVAAAAPIFWKQDHVGPRH
jgi:MFS family permease